MTRALKQFLKLKKWYCERQECWCLLISMRRDYENHPEYCWCGDEAIPTPTTYTVKFQSNNNSYGTVSPKSVEVEAGTAITISGNVFSLGDTDVVATAEPGYIFSRWSVRWGGTMPETITSDLTINATFEAYVPITAIDAPSEDTLTLVEGTSDTSITFTYDPVDATHVIADVTITSDDEDVARAMIEDFDNGVATLHIDWASAGNATVTYSFGVASYDIDVTVTQSP